MWHCRQEVDIIFLAPRERLYIPEVVGETSRLHSMTIGQ